MNKNYGFLFALFMLLVAGRTKHKAENICNSSSFQMQPFVEKFGYFFCGSNDYEYAYIVNEKMQIDSLTECTFSPPIAFPTDEKDMLYIAVGRLSYHNKDTFQTSILKDTCLKKLTYEVNMIQRDTTVNCCPYGVGAVLSMFCSVENIPADYQVEVKYKYVPIQ